LSIYFYPTITISTLYQYQPLASSDARKHST
jgi:hypothetical protein